MARKTSRSTALAAPRAAAPVIHISPPRPIAPVKHKRRGGGGRRGASSGGGSIVEMSVAAYVVGLAEKSGVLSAIPSIPMIGKKGTAAIALHFFGKSNAYARKAALVLAIVSAHEFGKNGSIDGED